MLFKLYRLLDRRDRILNIFNKMLKKLEENNMELEKVKNKALDKVNHYNSIISETQSQMKINKKTIDKLNNFLN